MHLLQSEIQCVIDSRREEMARDSIDDRSAPEQEGLLSNYHSPRIISDCSGVADLSIFPVRLPLELNKCNRLLSLFQSIVYCMHLQFLLVLTHLQPFLPTLRTCSSQLPYLLLCLYLDRLSSIHPNFLNLLSTPLLHLLPPQSKPLP